MNSYSLAQNFFQYFQIKLANTEALRQETFKIRYNVYAEELGWEPFNAAGMETDKYDEYAYHCLLVHRRTGIFAGCVRLIIPPKDIPSWQLPFEENCLFSALPDIVDSTKMPRGSFGEISRLAVLNRFRRRKGERNVPFVINDVNTSNAFSEEEKRNFPNIAIGLYLAAVALSDINDHIGMFVMMEPRLNRRLRRFGLPFVQCGSEIDYHGLRAMFYLERAGFYADLTPELFELYDMIRKKLRVQCPSLGF